MKPSVIWTLCACDPWDVNYICDAMKRAATEGVSGIEICQSAIDRFISYRAFPALQGGRDVKADQEILWKICDEARRLKLQLGLWHHEIWGPDDLLELLPELKAADGLINLETPLLYRFITEKCREFFELFPTVDELVLTLTETQYVVAQRPFSEITPSERIRRVLQAVADVTESLGKHLVIRPFSAVRADELYVRDAVEKLKARNVSVMYKTEPFDWNPFLPNEPLIGTIPRHEARAETDAGAEYYGQADFPCCYVDHIKHRLAAAREKGARTAIIRADRGATHTALGNPVNELNVIAPTRWWLGTGTAEVPEYFEQSFEVIKKSLYIDGQSLSHNTFPDLKGAKHVLTFALFEENVPLDHLSEHWSMLTDRHTLTHEQILREKDEAVALACELANRDKRLARLVLLAEACRQFCRVAIAHIEDKDFDREAAALVSLADEIEKQFGAEFFRQMPARMRDVATGLAEERRLEIPLRRALKQEPGLVDYVVCGFASEGHRLAKRLHTGETFCVGDRYARTTGIGPDEGFSYELKSLVGVPQRLRLDATGTGIVRVGDREFPLTKTIELPPQTAPRLRVHFISTSPQPCQVSTMVLSRP